MSPQGAREAIEAVDLLVVGAGFFGLTIARCAAEELGARVAIIERRAHIGGNAYSYVDPETNIEVHKYGSHLFHTSNQEVWDFSRRFTDFNNYRHYVYTVHRGRTFSMPINLSTLCAYFERSLTPSEARELIESATLGLNASSATNLEDRAIALIGEDLYRSFIAGYTEKQWQTNPRLLPPEIISRLPVRFTFDSRYFSDTYEGLPLDGYHSWFARLVDHPSIEVFTDLDYFDIRSELRYQPPLVFTGPIDRYFDYRAGPLSWRTLDFETETLSISDFQGTAVMNYADIDAPFTRIHEPRHLHPERIDVARDRTIIMREYSRAAQFTDEPYYPIRTEEDRRRLQVYRNLARSEPRVIFGGRLGTYAYLDMHMAMASALQTFRNQVAPMLASARA